MVKTIMVEHIWVPYMN